MGQRCMDASTVRHLQRDGLGWGHDLDAGCFEVETVGRPDRLRRLWTRLARRTV